MAEKRKRQPRKPKPETREAETRFKEYVKKHPDMSVNQLKKSFRTEYGTGVGNVKANELVREVRNKKIDRTKSHKIKWQTVEKGKTKLYLEPYTFKVAYEVYNHETGKFETRFITVISHSKLSDKTVLEKAKWKFMRDLMGRYEDLSLVDDGDFHITEKFYNPNSPVG